MTSNWFAIKNCLIGSYSKYSWMEIEFEEDPKTKQMRNNLNWTLKYVILEQERASYPFFPDEIIRFLPANLLLLWPQFMAIQKRKKEMQKRGSDRGQRGSLIFTIGGPGPLFKIPRQFSHWTVSICAIIYKKHCMGASDGLRGNKGHRIWKKSNTKWCSLTYLIIRFGRLLWFFAND